MKKILIKHITGKKVLYLFVITNLVYAFMLAYTIPKTMVFSKGKKLLDMMPLGYNYEYVKSLFDVLGKTGRNTYLYNQIPVDMLYPVLFGISYCLLILYFLKKINKINSFFFYLCFLPIIAGIADYLENFGIITMLTNYPDLTQSIVITTNIFSIIKSMITTISFIVLIIIITLFVVKKTKKHV